MRDNAHSKWFDIMKQLRNGQVDIDYDDLEELRERSKREEIKIKYKFNKDYVSVRRK